MVRSKNTKFPGKPLGSDTCSEFGADNRKQMEGRERRDTGLGIGDWGLGKRGPNLRRLDRGGAAREGGALDRKRMWFGCPAGFPVGQLYPRPLARPRPEPSLLEVARPANLHGVVAGRG